MRNALLFGLLVLSTAAFTESPANPAANNATSEKRPEIQRFNPAAVDKSVSPCDDFYAYACNPWLAANPIPPDRGAFGRGSQMYLRNQYAIRDVLQEASLAKTGDADTQKVGAYYAACMDDKAVNAKGLSALKNELGAIAAVKSKAELPPLLARLHAMTNNLLPATDGGQHTAFFGFGSIQDFDDASKVVVAVDQGGISLPQPDYYIKDDAKSVELRKGLQQHVQRMFQLSGDKPELAAREAQLVLSMETELARSSMDIVARREPANLNHKMSLAQLQQLSPDFDWNAYIKVLNPPTPDHYIVTTPDFIKAWNQQVNARSLDDLKTYLRWNLLHASATNLPDAFVNENFDFFARTLNGAKELPPRWKRCGTYVDRDLGEALGKAYVARHFTPDTKARTLQMVDALEKAVEKDIRALDWMTDATKQEAITKLHGIMDKIGYPEKWRDYSTLTVKRDDALGNAFRSSEFELHRQLNKVGKPVDRAEWNMTPPTVDAYYDPQSATINFPAGILQPPEFDPTMDDAVNFGAAGSVIGHELTHGFDDQGRHFDATGNLRDWWTPEDTKAFEERAACIADQYSGYVATADVKLNGRLTLGENIADSGGLRVAYMALMDRLAASSAASAGSQNGGGGEAADAGKDGLDPQQRFFLSYAQAWCRNSTDANLRLLATSDPHSPPRYRVNGVLTNMPEFHKAFGCKAGDKMVRENACRVW